MEAQRVETGHSRVSPDVTYHNDLLADMSVIF